MMTSCFNLRLLCDERLLLWVPMCDVHVPTMDGYTDSSVSVAIAKHVIIKVECGHVEMWNEWSVQ